MKDLFDFGLKTAKLRLAFFGVFLARMLMGLIMFVNPLGGWVISQVLDYLDAVVLDQIYGIGRVYYTRIDKVMDLGVDIIMLAVSWNFGSFLPLLALIIFRTIGQFVYWKTGKQWIFILFPNFFESYWLWTVIVIPLTIPGSLLFLKGFWGLTILLLIKLFHEVFNHYLYPKYIYKHSMDKVWKPIKSKIKYFKQ